MVKIRSREKTNGSGAAPSTQRRSLKRLISRGSLLPILSNRGLVDLVFGTGTHEKFIKIYGRDELNYPAADDRRLHRLAKYRGLTNGWKDLPLKEDYLDRIASYIFQQAEEEERPNLAEAEDEAPNLTVSQLACRLEYLALGENNQHPLMILANLPLPIYITTSPYTFIEAALNLARKKPRSELSRWHVGLDSVRSVFETSGWPPVENPCAGDKSEIDELPCEHNPQGGIYTPCEHKPLVYHLYGWDKYPDSIVLTEDDYLNFLMAVSQGRGKDNGIDPIHDVVKGRFVSSALLLLGFGLSSWSFRALYWGLMKPMPQKNQYQRYSVQVDPDAHERQYMEDYLRIDARFDGIYWELINTFIQRELAG